MSADLPSPEERILKSIHASQRKVEQPILGSLIPILPGVPECTIRVCGSIRLNALQVEAAIVNSVTVLSGNCDTEGDLTGKNLSISRQRKRGAGDGVPGIHSTLPPASLRRPNTSHLTVWCGDIDRVCVGLTVEREVWVLIDSDSIDVGQQAGPKGETTDAVANRDEWALAFTNTCDSPDDLVDFIIASDYVLA